MGTTLTGTKIKDTYKSLIKVTNNTEAGSSAKQLSDGNGNDFGVYIDTDGVLGIGGAASVAIDASSKNDAIRLPNGTTTHRASITAQGGMIRYNTTTSKFEIYDGAWKNIFTEAGGTIDGDVTVTGDLTVQGSTTTISSETVTFEDNILLINKADAADTPYNTTSAGIEIEKSGTNPSFIHTFSDETWTLSDHLTVSKSGGVNFSMSAGAAGGTHIKLTPNATGSGTGRIYTTNTLDLGLGVNSTDIITLTSNNRVGINTNSPDYDLDVAGNAGFDEYLYHNGDTDTYIKFENNKTFLGAGGKELEWFNNELRIDENDSSNSAATLRGSNTAGELYLYSGGLLKTLFKGDGNSYITGGRLGLGTTSPASIFHVFSADDSLGIFKSTDNKAYIQLSDDDTDAFISVENDRIAFGPQTGTHADNLNYDLTNKRLGIGTTSPAIKLHVEDTGSQIASTGFYYNTKISDDSNAGLLLGHNNTANGAGMIAGINEISFLTYGTSWGERMRIHSNGSTEFKTGSTSTLDIANQTAGSIVIGNGSGSAQIPNIVGRSTSNAAALTLTSASTNTNTSGDMVFNVRENNNSTFATLTNNAFKWQHYTTDLMVLRRDGRLGIGTTSPLAPLHVNTSEDVTALFLSTDGTSKIEFADNNTTGSTRPSIGASGNNTIFTHGTTERMRIASGGSVGIATNSPLDKLHVNGRIRTNTDGLALGDTNAVLYRNSNDLEIRTYAGYDINLIPANNVGIGTTSPAAKLHVSGSNAGAIFKVDFTNSTGGFSQYTSNSANLGYIGDNYHLQSPNTNEQGNFGIRAENDMVFLIGSSQKLRITSDGAIEIKGQGTSNTFIGDSNAGNLGTSTGTNNTALGNNALGSLTSGGHNVIIGNTAGEQITEGDYNVALGSNALGDLTTGDHNIGIGNLAGNAGQAVTHNIAIGYAALYAENSQSGNIAIGRETLRNSNGGAANTGVGFRASYSLTTGDYNTSIGYQAGRELTTGSGHTFLGYASGYGATASTYITGVYNTGVGFAALYHVTTGSNNVAIGKNAAYELTTATNVTAIGEDSLQNLTTGNYNTAVGRGAGLNLTTGYNNTILGNEALVTETTGHSNVAVGYAALNKQTQTVRNTAVGYAAGYRVTTGNDNVMLGYNAGRYRNDGTDDLNPADSVYIGYDARGGGSDASPSNEIVIGFNARGNGDNTVTIGNSSVTDTYLVGGSVEMDSDNWFKIGGNVLYADIGQTILQVRNNTGVIKFRRSDATEMMRITASGNVLVGKTNDDQTSAGVKIDESGYLSGSKAGTSLYLNRKTSDGSVAEFWRNGTTVGSISVTSSATSYNTSSDYRLKTDLKDFNGSEMLSNIKMYDFAWKADESRSYGVMAHELQEVLPQAVSGKKDGEEMQSVDYSKIVPVLVKALQEANERIEKLENKLK